MGKTTIRSIEERVKKRRGKARVKTSKMGKCKKTIGRLKKTSVIKKGRTVKGTEERE